MSNETDVLLVTNDGKAVSNYVITTSLGGLMGVKGSIPILIVALGSRISDRCPLHLEDTWLDSWASIVCLILLLVFELLADCIPAVASIQDVLMLFVKPALGIALALTPSYGEIYGVSSAAGWLAAFSAALLAVLVGLMKAAWTLACDGTAAGLCSFFRSCLENIFTSIFTVLIFLLGLLAAAVLLLFTLLFVGRFLVRRFCQKEDSATTSDDAPTTSDEEMSSE